MNIVTATEFRKNQRKYFDLAEKETVYVTRAGKSPIAVTAIELDEDYPSTEELQDIREGLEAYRRGECTTIEDPKNIWASIL